MAPILLAVSDNGPQMTSGSTREFMAMCAIAQHFGRPGTPTDQAWIESLFSHLKAEWPHLEHITDPSELRAELARVRVEYNTVRLHAGIGYVTPDDEHEGRGPQIRQARRAGLHRARRAADRVPSNATQSTPTARAPGCGLIGVRRAQRRAVGPLGRRRAVARRAPVAASRARRRSAAPRRAGRGAAAAPRRARALPADARGAWPRRRRADPPRRARPRSPAPRRAAPTRRAAARRLGARRLTHSSRAVLPRLERFVKFPRPGRIDQTSQC